MNVKRDKGTKEAQRAAALARRRAERAQARREVEGLNALYSTINGGRSVAVRVRPCGVSLRSGGVG